MPKNLVEVKFYSQNMPGGKTIHFGVDYDDHGQNCSKIGSPQMMLEQLIFFHAKNDMGSEVNKTNEQKTKTELKNK